MDFLWSVLAWLIGMLAVVLLVIFVATWLIKPLRHEIIVALYRADPDGGLGVNFEQLEQQCGVSIKMRLVSETLFELERDGIIEITRLESEALGLRSFASRFSLTAKGRAIARQLIVTHHF